MAYQVVHLITSADPECSAQARIVASLAPPLAKNYRLHCCFLQSPGPLSDEVERDGIDTYVIGWNGSRSSQVMAAVKLYQYLRRGRFSILHQHGGGVVNRLLARAAGVKVNILHLHTRVYEKRGLQQISVSPRVADAVIATSHAAAKCVRGMKAQIIYPGVTVEPSAGCNSAHKRCVIGTAARFVAAKGLEYLLRAVSLVRREVPEVRLQIAGSGPLYPKLESEVRQLGLSGCIEFLGWQSPLKPWLARWDVFALPSVEEAFGMAALEAMAAGLPVVATDVGGIPELITNGTTGWLVPPRDPPSLAARLVHLLRDREARHRMGTASQARVRSHFSRERMVTSTAALYDSLLRTMD